MNEENSPLENIEDKKAFVAFGAKWCGPWSLIQPALDALESDGVEVIRIDVDEHPKLSDKYAVVSVPTFLSLDHGKELRRKLGAVSPQEIKEIAKGLK